MSDPEPPQEPEMGAIDSQDKPPPPLFYYGARKSLKDMGEDPEPEGPKSLRPIGRRDLPTSIPSLSGMLRGRKTWLSERDSLQLNEDEEAILLKYWGLGGSLDTFSVASDLHNSSLMILMIDRHFLPHHPVAQVGDQIARKEASLKLSGSQVDLASFEGLLELRKIKTISGIEKVFRNLRLLSTGSTFQVFLSEYSGSEDDQDSHIQPGMKSGNRVVMKKILAKASPPSQDRDAPFQVPRAVIQELRILTAVGIQGHENVIKLFAIAWDIGATMTSHKLGFPVMIQEHAEYGNLQDFLVAAAGDGLLSPQLKAKFCCNVAAGLQILHDHNLVHSDVKCENILVARGKSDQDFVAKVSDFGFSVILQSSDHLVDIPINLQGTTLRYAAPEIYAQRDSMSVCLARAEVRKIDIYSYAMLVYTIALSGRDMFGVLADLQYTIGKIAIQVGNNVVTDFDWEKPIRDSVIESTIESTKLNARTGRWVRNVLSTIVKESDLAFVTKISPILEAMLVQDPRARSDDFAIVWQSLAPGSGPQSRIPNRTAGAPSIDEKMPSELANRPEVFWIDGRPLELVVHEIRFSHEFMLATNSGTEASRQNVVGVWKAKAALLDTLESPKMLTIESRAMAAVCAHQVAVCYLYGIGVETSPQKACDTILKSARAGYVTSLCLARPFCEASEVACPDDLPIIDALGHRVALGPAYGHFAWAFASKVLKRLDIEAYTRACGLLDSNGWLEVGELGGRWLDPANRIQGGDPRFFHIVWGTYDAVLWCVHRLPAVQFFDGLERGTIPQSFSNHNDERLLYMCCRAGQHEKVIELLRRYENARADVVRPTKTGMTPVHWMFAMDISHAQIVLDLLLENGADLSIRSDDGMIPIQHALMHDRVDIANLLYSYESNDVWATNRAGKLEDALLLALNNHAFDTARRMMERASFENIKRAVASLYASRIETRIAWHGPAYRSSCTKIIRFLRSCDLESLRGDKINKVFASALQTSLMFRTTDVVQALLEPEFVQLLDIPQNQLILLMLAARWSQFTVFQQILELSEDISISNGSELLDVVIISPGPDQLAIAQILVDRLVRDGTIEAAIPFVAPAENKKEDDRAGPFGQLWSAIDEEVFQIADLLLPYDQHIKGKQRTIMHTLLVRNPVRENVILQLEYLIDRDSSHADLISDPFDGRTVIHEAISNHRAFKNEWQFRDVLSFLLDQYSEGADQADNHGIAPLHMAAAQANVAAVEILLEYGASPNALAADTGKTAFDLALHGVLGSLVGEMDFGVWGDKAISHQQISRFLKPETKVSRAALFLDVMSKFLNRNGHPYSQLVYLDPETGALVTRPEFYGGKGTHVQISAQQRYTEEEWEALVRKAGRVDEGGRTYLLTLYGSLVFFIDFGPDEKYVGAKDTPKELILELLRGQLKYRHNDDGGASHDGFRVQLQEASQILMRQEEG